MVRPGDLTEGHIYEFCFLVADVTGSSTYKRSPKRYPEENIKKTLINLRNYINGKTRRVKCVEMDWAGDGGIWFFYGNRAPTNSVFAAIDIINGLIPFNIDKNELPEDVKLKIALDKGNVEYKVKYEELLSDALNFAAHLKSQALPNQIIISENIYYELNDRYRNQFSPLGEFENKKIYVFGEGEIIKAQLSIPEKLKHPEIPMGVDIRKDIEVLFNTAIENRDKNQFTEAISMLRNAIRLTQEEAFKELCYIELGRTLNLDGQYQTTLTTMKDILKNYDNPDLYQIQGLAYIHTGNYSKAKKALDKASGLYKNPNLKLYVSMSLLEWETGNLTNAINYTEQALELESNNQTVINNKAYYCADRGTAEDLKIAERLSKKNLKSDPINPSRLDTRAFVLFKRHKLDEAELFARQVLHKNPNYTYSLLNLGRILKAKDKKPEATALFQKIIAQEKYGTKVVHDAKKELKD